MHGALGRSSSWLQRTAFAVTLVVAGCGGDGSGSVSDIHLSSYVPVQPQQETNRIVGEIWQVLTSARCWSVDTGAARGTNNYRFFGNYQYRFAGITDTSVGSIRLESAGKYQDKNAAIVQMDDRVFIVVLSPTAFARAFEYNGRVVVTTWTAAQTCV